MPDMENFLLNLQGNFAQPGSVAVNAAMSLVRPASDILMENELKQMDDSVPESCKEN
jgi:hypothetical protein